MGLRRSIWAWGGAVVAAGVLIGASVATAQQHDHAGHQNSGHAAHGGHGGHGGHAMAPDHRQLVTFPEAMKAHTLSNMRDHLLALQEIQEAMSVGALDRAASVAETRLGMTALKAHGAHESSKFMPKGMQEAGTAMHRGASQFAVVVADASATGDLRPALAKLAQVTQSCVACHAGYKLQ